VVDAPKEMFRPVKPVAAPALRSTRHARASAAEAAAEAPHEAKSDRAVALSEPPAERQVVAPAADPAELRSDRAEEIAARARASYEQVLAAWLERHKRYPLLARRRGSQGTTAIRIRIGRDGRVLASEIERSSEQSILDEAALSMVRQADPFPSMPADLPGTRFEFVAPIRFRVE
jgi:TonB family protein